MRVFKHPPPRAPISAFITVIIDAGEGRSVPAIIAPAAEDLAVDARSLLDLLRPLTKPAALQQLKEQVTPAGWLPVAALHAAGLTATFDPRRFELTIDTPPDLRVTRVRHLSPPPPDLDASDAVRPAAVSGFVNANLKATHQTDHTPAGRQQQDTAVLALDGALNLQGVVLEGAAFGRSGGGTGWERGDLRLVYDQPARALRFTAGDLSNTALGYQPTLDLLGLGLARDFSLQPHVPTWRTNQFEFYLQRPAEVKIWVNDSLVNTLQLPAGAHDLRGLNSAVGLNDVRLQIEDDAGRHDELEFSFLFNPILLERGRQAFSYQAGFMHNTTIAGRHYDFSRPALNASHQFGLRDTTTLGSYLQAAEQRTFAGIQLLQALPFGTAQLDAVLRRLDATPWTGAARLELAATPQGPHSLQAQAGLEYFDRGYRSLAGHPARSALAVRASVAAQLRPGLTGRLSGSYTPAPHDAARDARSLMATLTRRWGRFVTGSISLRHRRPDSGPEETDLRFGLTLSFSRGRQNYFASKELETDAVATRWSTQRSTSGAAPYGFAESRLESSRQEYRAGAGYQGHRGYAELSHRQTESTLPPGRTSAAETSLRLQGALVFTDGLVALSRPVTENFAIITGHQGLAGVPLQVDPDQRGGARAGSDRFGPAVLEDLPSYRAREVRIEPVNPPLGATPEKTAFVLAPTYKSGVALRLGRPPQIIAIGRLVDDQGQPLAHVSVTFARPGAPPVTTFTSRSGLFQMPDVQPGRYEITPDDPAHTTTTITIPPAPDGLVRLGDVVAPAR